MGRFSLIVLFLAISLLAANAVSQTVPIDAGAFPNTPIGSLMRELVAVINTGSETEMRSFVAKNFGQAAVQTGDDKEYVHLMGRIHAQSGGIESVSVRAPAPPYAISVLVKSRTSDRYLSIAAGHDPREPGKIAGIATRTAVAPGTVTSIRWPEAVLSESEMIGEIKRQVAKRAAEGKFSGVLLIAKDDVILLHEAHGIAERSFKVPVDLDTKFNLASVGKMFTATAIAQLVNERKLKYEDKLIKHLPDFPNKEAAEKITIHQLLTHTAGMGTLFGSPGYERLKRYKNSWDELSAIANEPLFFEPGTSARYSNGGFVALAAVIERITGKRFVDYVAEKVFKPLGMADTGYPAHDEVLPNMSVLYTMSPDDPFGIEPYVADHVLAGYRGNGEGGGYSTTADLFKFARNYRTGKLLGKEMQEFVATPKVKDGRADIVNTGYGVFDDMINGQRIRGHSGGGRTDLQMIWDSGYTVIVQTNTLPPSVTTLSREILQFMTKQISMRDIR